MAITIEMHGKVDKKLSPQCRCILNHLQKRGSITALEAMKFYGIMRLASRIWDLMRAGYPIKKEIVERINRHTQKVHIAKYTLPKEAAN